MLFAGTDKGSNLEREITEFHVEYFCEAEYIKFIILVEEKSSYPSHELLKDIQNAFEEINSIQSKLNIELSTLNDIKFINFDTTNSNTGKYNGLGVLLNEARQKEFIKLKMNGIFEELEIMGCLDHIMVLIHTHIYQKCQKLQKFVI